MADDGSSAAGWTKIGLGLGSNLGDPPAAIRSGLERLVDRGHVRLRQVSAIYRTKPWGPVPQPDFANACALCTTDLTAPQLLAEIKAVERRLGRGTSERWGPRVIDIDILFYGDATYEMPDLVIPHASLFERAFVLVPLAEIAPGLVIGGRSVADAAAWIERAGIERWPA